MRGRVARKGRIRIGRPSASALTWSDLLLIKDQALYWLGKASEKQVGDLIEVGQDPHFCSAA